MPGRIRPVVCLALVVGSSIVLHAQKPALPDVLTSAAAYVQEYAKQLAAPVVAEEEYTQRETTAGVLTRRLHADFVLTGGADGSIAGFRDVFAIDSRDVRKRDERLVKLMQGTWSDASQAQALAFDDEGVRYYLSPNLRVLDIPTVPLGFLRPDKQNIAEFEVESVKTMDGAQVAILKFRTKNAAHVMTTPDGASVLGRFWIEVGTGVVRQTEIGMSGKGYSFRTTTKYAQDPALKIWLPSEVSQQVDITSGGSGAFSNMGAGGGMNSRQSLEARTRYSKYRRPTSS